MSSEMARLLLHAAWEYADKHEKLITRIEAAKQRLESLNGQHVGQAEIYAVIEILEDNSPEIPEGST